jgi:uncharacterized protein
LAGTILNALAVIIGSAIGMLVGARIPEKTQTSIVTGLGFVVLSLGLQNSFESGNILIPLFSIALGVIIGESLDIQAGLDGFGGWLQRRFSGGEAAQRERFINGFVTASLVFCIGPLTILGSLEDGMHGDPELLILKSALDFFASIAFAASLGSGVAFSAVTILLIQGSIAILGALAGEIMSDAMINELTATGGLLLIGISLILMSIQRPRMANYLPALALAPLFVAVLTALGVDIYP